MANRREPPTARAQLARVVSWNRDTGDVKMRWLTASDLGSAEFTIKSNQWLSGEGGAHWMGGPPMEGDVVYVDAVSQYRHDGILRTMYRFQSASIDRNYAEDVRLGRIPLMEEGDKFVRSAGGAEMYLDSGGNVTIDSGYRSPGEQLMRAQVERTGEDFNHDVPLARDRLSILAEEVPGDDSPVRVLHSTVGPVTVQWGNIARVRDLDERFVDRVSETAGEFRAAVGNSDRTEEYVVLHLGHAHDVAGAPVQMLRSGNHLVAGIRVTPPPQQKTGESGIGFDTAGNFEWSDAHGNWTRTTGGRVETAAAGRWVLGAADEIRMRVAGTWFLRARTGELTYHNLSRTVGGDSYAETVFAEHRINRFDTYEDVASSTGPNTPSYRWEIEPGGVSRITMELDKIELGNDSSQSNVVLEPGRGTLGTDAMTGQVVYEPESTTIGSGLSQAEFELDATSVTVGTGTPIDVNFSVTENLVGHTVRNVVRAPVNFISPQVVLGATPGPGGAIPPNSQPVVQGTDYATLLQQMLTQLQTLSAQVATLSSALTLHTHTTTAPGAPTSPPDPAFGTVAGTVAGNASAVQGALGTAQGQVPGTLSTNVLTT